MKNVAFFFVFAIFTLLCFKWLASSTLAEYPKSLSADESSSIRKNLQKEHDLRVKKLKNALKSTPLENSAENFIKIAEKYKLNNHPFLIAAISGVESSFGKYIPFASYNAWGFGIPTGSSSGKSFKSWEEGIEEVTKALTTQPIYNRHKNLNDLSIEELVSQIGPVYAASPLWPQKVLFFIEKIENTPSSPISSQDLQISL